MLTAQVEIGMSDTSGGKVKRTVFLIILIIFAVMTPAWSEVLRNTNIDYVLDLYKKVESFGFYENSDGTGLIGTGTVNGVTQTGKSGTSNNPFEIKPEKQQNTPQFYFIIQSNYTGRTYDLKLNVSTFNNKSNNSSIGYRLMIQNETDDNYYSDSAEIVGETFKEEKYIDIDFHNYFNKVESSTKPDKWVWGFYYIFDEELGQAAEGDYIATVKMEVTVQ